MSLESLLNTLQKTSCIGSVYSHHFQDIHCVKSVRIRSYSGLHFPIFRLNTERYSVSLHIQSKCGKTRTRITSNTDPFNGMIAVRKQVSIITQRDTRDERVTYDRAILFKVNEPRYKRCGVTPHFPKTKKQLPKILRWGGNND